VPCFTLDPFWLLGSLSGTEDQWLKLPQYMLS
jgi:hypothetical protein